MAQTPGQATQNSTRRTIDLPPLSLRADLQPQTVNVEDRSVEVVWTTGADVVRFDWESGSRYIERLSLKPEHIRLERLNAGAAFLDSHSAWSISDVLGSVVPGSVKMTKSEGRARVRLSRREAVEPIWRDIQDGIIRSISVGYRIHQFQEDAGKGNKLPVRLATDWEPFELSAVAVPADAAAAVRGAKPTETFPCEIVPAPLSDEPVTRAEAAPSQPSQPAPTKEQKPMEPTNERSEFVVEEPEPAPVVRKAAPVTPTEPNEADAAIARERARNQGIIAACRAARLPQSFADGLIAEGLALVDAQARVFAEMAKRGADDQGPTRVPSGAPHVEVGSDPLVHKRSGIENAILHRVAPEFFKLSDEGKGYRGLSMLDIGRTYLHAIGIRTSHMSKSALAEAMLVKRSGMHTTSDFPSLLADVANKTLRAAYDAAPQTWRPLAKMISASDFKAVNVLQVGDAPELLEVLEHGEFTSGTIAESKESVRLKTWGRIFAITRQALINDDLAAFAEIPAAFGRKSADKMSDLAWGVITTNGPMADLQNLFSIAHANLSGSSDAITVPSLGAARAALRKQKGIDGVTPLNLTPRYLVVPAGKETIADQYVSVVTPAQSSNANPFQPGGRTPLTVVAESRLDANSGTAWYMAADASQVPLLHFVTLDGQEGPEVRQMEGFDVDGVKYRCRLDVNFAAADHRAAFKNPGA